MISRARWVVPVAALLLIHPRIARADDVKVTAAESLFTEGRALLDEGRIQEACERFKRSDELDPAVGTLLNLGDCYERLGKTASAWTAYRQATTLATTRADERRAARARERAASLEPSLARLTITVASSSVQLVVKRDGEPIEPAALKSALPVDPGRYTIEASAPDRRPWQTTVDIADAAQVSVQVPELIPVSANAAPRAPQNKQRTLGVALASGGGALVATGLVFGGLALSRWSSVESTCPDAVCPSNQALAQQRDDAESARTYSTVSTITSVVGLVVLAGGIVLHLTAPKPRPATAISFDGATLRF